MDPLELEALRLGAAILAGGIVAAISSLLAFAYARRLQSDEGRRRDVALRRSLVAEVRENIRRLGGPAFTQVPSARILRSAWDAARGLQFGDEVFDALAVAYLHGAELEQFVSFTFTNIATRGAVWPWSTEAGARKKLNAITYARGQAAHMAFVKALKLLEQSG
jgi:hypothetical protein